MSLKPALVPPPPSLSSTPYRLSEDNFRFIRFRNDEQLSTLAKNVLGSANFAEIARTPNVRIDFLLDQHKHVGILAYVKPSSESFKSSSLLVKAFSIIDPVKNSDKGYEKALLERVKEISSGNLVESIRFEIPDHKPVVQWLKEQGASLSPGNSGWTGDFTFKEKKRTDALEPKSHMSSQKRALEIEETGREKKMKTTNIKTHRLPMRGTIYFRYIMEGTKQFEGRVNLQTCALMHVGDHLDMFDRQAGWGIKCEVTSKDTYSTFEEMLKAKGVLNMLPQLQEKSKRLSTEELISEGVAIYKAFPGAERVRTNGCVAIGVKFINKI